MKGSQTPFFSIVVPIYNAENYLNDCIESVCNQSFTSWELLLIDDGSTDQSGIIIDEYKAKDERIKTFHKTNGGEFSSRYIAICSADGEYVVGLDADDYYEQDFLQTIYNKIMEYQGEIDCVMFSFSKCGEKEGRIKLNDDYLGEYIEDEFLRFVLKTTLHSFCSKAIRTTLLKEIDFSDVPKVRISEDYLMVIPICCKIRKAVVIDYYGYNYRIHSDSASHVISYDTIIQLCQVSDYGIAVMEREKFTDKMYMIDERIGFLKVVFPRIIKALKEDRLSKSDIKRIRKNNAYKNASCAEKIKVFGIEKYINMKLFRLGMISILKKRVK